jgi:hypothetical protein
MIPTDVFDEQDRGQENMDPRAAYPLVERIMADDDANDPLLASYQEGVSALA